MILCDYGCGQEAKYQLKNGKWCCSKNHSSCPIQREKNSIKVKKIWENPLYKEKIRNKIKKIYKDPDSIYNSTSYKEKKRDSMKEAWKNPDSKLNLVSQKIKKIWEDPDSVYNSISRNEKIGNFFKITIKQIKERYPFFSKIEEMRYNPNRPNEKEIQVRCKNHNCENSKEKGGWFTPKNEQLRSRYNALEKDEGNDGNYFYCSQECKDTCFLYNIKGDPYKNTDLPYTYQENQLWRQTVLELDKGLCQFCGKPATDVHHIKPVKTHPHLALDPDNGISFCEECHYKIGHQGECSTGNLAKTIQQGCSLGGQT